MENLAMIGARHTVTLENGVENGYAWAPRCLPRLGPDDIMLGAELVGSPGVTDCEVESAAECAATASTDIENTGTLQVRDRHLTRSGTAAPNVRRDAAQQIVRHLSGLEPVQDRITVSPRTSVETAAQRIKDAMRRNPHLDDTHVTVTIVDGTAVLTGSVPSPTQLAQAALATGASPEVTRIDNRLRVRAW